MSRRRSLRLKANIEGVLGVNIVYFLKFLPFQFFLGVLGGGDAGEEIEGQHSGEVAEDNEDIQGLLPKRLFTTDQFLSERVNTYSTLDHLLAVRDALKGTPKMDELMGSCFGSLFKLPVRRVLSVKVVHEMLTRQVVTKKK